MTRQTLRTDRLDANRLQLSKTVTLHSDDEAALDFLQVHLPLAAEEHVRVTREDVQALPAPAPKDARQLMQSYHSSLAARDAARDEYLRLVEEIDEAVFDAFELPDRLRKIVRRRMTEFPLNENAARYRKPWEPTRRPKIKVFEAGKRYQ